MVQAWERLEDTAATLPTQGIVFAEALSHSLLAEAPMEVFAASGAGGIEALLPLCRDTGPLARWRLVGPGEVFEPADALCDHASAAQALAGKLAGQGRPLALDRLPAGSPLVPALRAAMRGKGLTIVRPAVPCPTIALDASWADPVARFNAGRRSDFRRAERKAREFGAVTYEILSPGPVQFDTLFDEAVAVELRSWKQEAGSAIAADPAKEAFFRAFFRAACDTGAFRIAFLRIDGTPAAMQMALEWRGRFWLFKIGYDERFSRASPGTLLMLHTIGWAAARGLSDYELMGNVEPWIAEFWTRDEHPCVSLRTYPANWRGALALAHDGAGWLASRIGRK